MRQLSRLGCCRNLCHQPHTGPTAEIRRSAWQTARAKGPPILQQLPTQACHLHLSSSGAQLCAYSIGYGNTPARRHQKMPLPILIWSCGSLTSQAHRRVFKADTRVAPAMLRLNRCTLPVQTLCPVGCQVLCKGATLRKQHHSSANPRGSRWYYGTRLVTGVVMGCGKSLGAASRVSRWFMAHGLVRRRCRGLR